MFSFENSLFPPYHLFLISFFFNIKFFSFKLKFFLLKSIFSLKINFFLKNQFSLQKSIIFCSLNCPRWRTWVRRAWPRPARCWPRASADLPAKPLAAFSRLCPLQPRTLFPDSGLGLNVKYRRICRQSLWQLFLDSARWNQELVSGLCCTGSKCEEVHL